MNKDKIINLLLFNPLTLGATAFIIGLAMGYIIAIPITTPFILFTHYLHRCSWYIKTNIIDLSIDFIELVLFIIFLIFMLFCILVFLHEAKNEKKVNTE